MKFAYETRQWMHKRRMIILAIGYIVGAGMFFLDLKFVGVGLIALATVYFYYTEHKMKKVKDDFEED